MSIASSIHAEWSNKRKDEWVSKLWEAYHKRDWDAIFAIIEEIEAYQWTE